MIPRIQTIAVLASCVTSCAQPAAVVAVDRSTAAEPLAIACRALVAAEPADWPDRLPAVLAGRAAATQPLIAELRRAPEAPGAQAAVAALGQLGGDGAHACLVELLASPGDLATEAALALATATPPLGAAAIDATRSALAPIAADPLADPTLRAACAHSLLRLGVRTEVRDLVRAIVLADTPAGRDVQQRVGLPAKTRWAYERYLVAGAIAAVAGPQLAFDTDASWPALATAADRIDAWLESQR